MPKLLLTQQESLNLGFIKYLAKIPRRNLLARQEKEEKEFGEYCTRYLVLEAWDGLEDIEFSIISCYPI
jgi:hypothetical protein